MSRHRAAHRHAGHRRLHGTPGYTPRHAAGTPAEHVPTAAVEPFTAPRASLVALVAPGLDLRPIDARPRGPQPYEIHPPTQPWALVEGAAA